MGLGTCTPARVYSPPALDYTKLLPRLPYKWTVSVSYSRFLLLLDVVSSEQPT